MEALKDILRTHHKTLTVLSDYPAIPTNIDSITNEALGLFLHAHVSANVKGVLVGTDPKDGLAILVQLQKMYASATVEDRVNALFYLDALQMHPKDTMNNFIMKFRHAIKAVAMYHKTQIHHPLLSTSSISFCVSACMWCQQAQTCAPHYLSITDESKT